LLRRSPAAYLHERANPRRKRVFDIGTAAHLMVLEPEAFDARVFVLDQDDYRTKAAQEAREEAYATNRTPLLPREAAMVRAMRDALFADPLARHAFEGGTAEQTILWQDAEFGVWRRTRPDYLPPHCRYLVDYKTTTSARPDDFAKAVVSYGYHQQAAWYLDGVAALGGEAPTRFCFVAQEKEPPYLVSVCWLDEEAIEIGRALNRRAVGVFAWCLRHNEWPGHVPEIGEPPRAHTIRLPVWAIKEYERARDAGELEPPNMESEAA
jgi:hypothetical protein